MMNMVTKRIIFLPIYIFLFIIPSLIATTVSCLTEPAIKTLNLISIKDNKYDIPIKKGSFLLTALLLLSNLIPPPYSTSK